jgi:LysR family transcriptional regulator, hydrogen peroxide-inducible genes activator
MTIQQLEYIVALDTFRHFVKAAEHCNVTQPTLTMMVKKLEDETGVILFDRHSKPLKPTQAGESILLRARSILSEIHSLKQFVNNETESLEGEFTLGVIPTLAPYLLPAFLPEFVKSHPKTKLIIHEMQTDQIISSIYNETMDMGLVVTPLEEKNLKETVLFYEPFLLYLPPDHFFQKKANVKLSDIQLQDMLLLEEGHCFREQALALCKNRKHHARNGFDYESGSLETIKGLVDNGLGYTLVPELSVINKRKADNVKRFLEPQPVREVSIITGSSFTRYALLEHLQDCIQKSIPPSFRKISRYKRVQWR